ncbi:TPA: helix-turn-helix transcriptional regulator [Streptococcus agalactiae]|uniref:DNA-binding phage protein n=2 Tax=Streptococcus TaxID=1301 RepID=A0A9X9QNS0_STRDY|nr:MULTISPECIES: helix-turn-helix transcriptional regulator [Streptococcus]HEO6600595.1 helix-turn-helix transcriptional regulator [Streptococcus agalactiae]VTS77446.1 DNA-binding phage protein [Streptococcus dysgalactiae]GAY71228.1 DNA-binding phage protein [Streptococcus canis]HEO6606327.1 helix-turn-helix transcriptional regulator [Streptococcus agalactiae]HEO6632011.1 helix-turn-helix transcriptional regulator [Streptococcus agalactiae]
MAQWTLKACRVNAGYTLRQVANKVNKNFQTISKYEKDSTLIPFELLKELSELYQVKLDDIFLGDSTKKIELSQKEL